MSNTELVSKGSTGILYKKNVKFTFVFSLKSNGLKLESK